MHRRTLASRLLVVPLAVFAFATSVFATSTSMAQASSAASHVTARPAANDDVWVALGTSAWIAEGNRKATHVVYVFTDTECKYCRQLWQAMQPYLAKGKLQSRHVMVAIIAKDSLGRGAAVMDAAHPEAALKDNENSKSPRLALELAIPRSTLKNLDDNTQLMHRLGIQGTPAIVFQDDSGKSTVVQGVPPADVLAKILRPVSTK